ncbi:hypothetical protein FI667_g14513, partial [Globisporangium splendens]
MRIAPSRSLHQRTPLSLRRFLHHDGGSVAPCVIVNERIALWSLLPNPDQADCVAQDQMMVDTMLPCRPPFARLFLPMDGFTGVKIEDLWFHDDDHPRQHQRWAAALSNSPSRGYFALSLLATNSSSHPMGLKRDDLQQETLNAPIATRLLLSNAYINLWDFQVAPQEIYPLHEHLLPYVFINRTSGCMRNLDANLQPTGTTEFGAGDARFVDPAMQDTRCIHAFQNIGSDAIQQYVIEFKT